MEQCKISKIQVGTKVLTIDSQIPHVGSITHICVLEKGHTDKKDTPEEYCRCVCGFGWRKFHNES